jgi:hypothetical protein
MNKTSYCHQQDELHNMMMLDMLAESRRQGRGAVRQGGRR